MTTIQQTDDYLTNGMRWIARALGLLASGLFVLFVVCAGAKTLSALSWSSPRGMPLFIVLAMATASVLIAWRWELIGGAMAVVGAIALSALVYFGSGRALVSTILMISLPFLGAGVLFLACYWRSGADATLAKSSTR